MAAETKPANLAAALAAFQAELPKVGKSNKADAGTYSYKYADLAEISAAVLPLLGKHGLSFSAKPTLDDGGRFVLEYSLRHSSGEADTGRYPLPAANARPQDIGSAITYARRYTLCAVLGIAADEDDDGAAAPPADRRPVERHESTWDPAEQEQLREAYESEIAKATAEEITEIGKRVQGARKDGLLSPTTYSHLSKAAAARRGELNGGDHATDRQQPALSA